jgi:hypothetical protein
MGGFTVSYTSKPHTRHGLATEGSVNSKRSRNAERPAKTMSAACRACTPKNHAFRLFKSQEVKAWQRSIHRVLRKLVIGNGTWKK